MSGFAAIAVAECDDCRKCGNSWDLCICYSARYYSSLEYNALTCPHCAVLMTECMCCRKCGSPWEDCGCYGSPDVESDSEECVEECSSSDDEPNEGFEEEYMDYLLHMQDRIAMLDFGYESEDDSPADALEEQPEDDFDDSASQCSSASERDDCIAAMEEYDEAVIADMQDRVAELDWDSELEMESEDALDEHMEISDDEYSSEAESQDEAEDEDQVLVTVEGDMASYYDYQQDLGLN